MSKRFANKGKYFFLESMTNVTKADITKSEEVTLY